VTPLSGRPFTARLHGPGLDGGGATVRCHVSALGLQIDGVDPVPAVPVWRGLQWRRGGFNNGQLFIEWITPEGHWTLAFGEPDAAAALEPHLRQAQTTATGAGRATRSISAGLIVLLVGIPVLLLAGFLMLAGPMVDWAVSHIPVDMEISLGRDAFAQQRRRLALVEDHPALPMLRELGTRLTRGSRYPYEFHVANDPSINAFAMPGGFIVFHTGLLEEAGSAEEVAGVLAHEIQHVERRHGLRGLVHGAGWRVALSLVLGDTGGSLAASWAEGLGRLNFSRTQESEADALGVRRLIDHDIDPRGMAAFFRKLMAEGSGLPVFLSSHPASEARMQAIEAAIPAGRGFTPLPYDLRALTPPR
jgi:Zn-dependent protease with chaperone function